MAYAKGPRPWIRADVVRFGNCLVDVSEIVGAEARGYGPEPDYRVFLESSSGAYTAVELRGKAAREYESWLMRRVDPAT